MPILTRGPCKRYGRAPSGIPHALVDVEGAVSGADGIVEGADEAVVFALDLIAFVLDEAGPHLHVDVTQQRHSTLLHV
eukprot:scaffold13561_cov50-Prasinocladus_malaysianus.AAC.2